MSITLANIRTKLNNILGDVIGGATTANGATNKTTLIDSLLAKYPDKYVCEHFVLLTVAAESRKVEEFLSPSGTIRVYSPFTDQVATAIAYEIHKYDPEQKKLALNQALLATWPYFYKRVDDETLTGTGASATEYDVPAAFTKGFPDQVWLKNVSTDKISYERVYGVDFKEVGGSKKFYANIITDKVILLIGRTYLTQFTNDASTTELDDTQAEIVCLKAAANLYRMYSGIVDSQDSGRFDALATYYDFSFQRLVREEQMQRFFNIELDWSSFE